MSRLSLKETAILLLLMAEAREISNPELKKRYGLTLDGKERNHLNDLKLVESWKTGRSFTHVLTDQGWARCIEELATDAPWPKSGSVGAALHGVLAGLRRYLAYSKLSLADVFARRDEAATEDITAVTPAAQAAGDLEERIRTAYARLAKEPAAWVSLARLRPLLGDVPRAEVDSALTRMYRMPGVNLVPESNQKVLTREDRQAAVRIGDQDKHLLSIR